MAKLNVANVLNKRSNQVIEGKPKLPTPSDLEYGEIAVNYADGHETISLKNSSNEVATFSSDSLTDAKIDTAKKAATTKIKLDSEDAQITISESQSEVDGSTTYSIGFPWGEF